MSEMPDYIKILYVMLLKNGFTIDEVRRDLNGETFDCACEICGAWEGYTQATRERNRVIDFINNYAIVKS